ncbi:MAG TPA: hypothetical protein VNI54_07765 [Thermoanaerobaculia bacterium]|nr:hypothetical protein [Thermoanaerobaculia bacterium]
MRGAYWIAFAVCAVAATLPLLVTGILPAADLPEHMAQIALWKHLDHPCQPLGESFELQLATPYLLAYALMRALALVMTVSVTAKLTVWLTIVLLPLALRELLKRTSADPWLSLIGFLLAYGYAFYWGFLNFALAIPIGIYFIALLYDREAPIWKQSIVALVLLSAHALMFVFCAVVALLVAVIRREAKTLVPIVPPAVLLALFIVRLRAADATTEGGITMWKAPHQRLTDLPSLLFANAWEPFGLLLLFGLVVAIAVQRPGITRDLARWVLLAAALLVYTFAPFGAYGSAYFYPRFACAAFAGALFILERPRRSVVLSRALVVAIVLLWLGVLTARFHRFGLEVRDYEALLEQLPPNRRVAQFTVEPFSDHVPGPVYWHFGALYQVRRGGLAAWSFAGYYPQVVRYRPGKEPVVTTKSSPLSGIDWPAILQYDYLLVRGPDPRRWLFRDAPVPISVDRRVGEWSVFATPRARGPQRDCSPLGE